jgi:hypothetical protein
MPSIPNGPVYIAQNTVVVKSTIRLNLDLRKASANAPKWADNLDALLPDYFQESFQKNDAKPNNQWSEKK